MRHHRVGDRIAWVVAALLTIAVLEQFYVDPPVPASIGAAVAALAVLAALQPDLGLRVLAAFAPLASILATFARPGVTGARLAEGMVLAVLAGWTLRRAAVPRVLAGAPAVRWSGAALLAAVLASAAVSIAEYMGERWGVFSPGLLLSFLPEVSLNSGPVAAAIVMAEGVVLMIAVADVCAADPRSPAQIARAMIIGAGAAAVFNVLRILMLSMAQDQRLAAFVTNFLTMRVSVHYGDLNAAGSYFAMMLLMALALVPRARAIGIAGAVLTAIGLWVSGSRTAMGAAIAAAGLGAWAVVRSDRKLRLRVAAGLLIGAGTIAAATWLWYPAARNAPVADTMRMRVDNWSTAIRMTAASPLFGVGAGHFALRAPDFGPTRENAHNNYLQVLAELGIPGLACFLLVIAFAVREGLRRSHADPIWGMSWGVVAFLITCIAGHPLLVALVAYPFWTALGLMSTGHVDTSPPSAIPRRIVAAMVLFFAATLTLRMPAAARDANRENASRGLSRWQHQPDGSRLRWAGAQSVFYVSSSARAVRIPLRHGGLAAGPLEVRLFIDDREADRVVLERNGDWRIVRLLVTRRTGAPFVQIRLEVTGPPGTPLDVQPTADSGLIAQGRPVVEN